MIHHTKEHYLATEKGKIQIQATRMNLKKQKQIKKKTIIGSEKSQTQKST